MFGRKQGSCLGDSSHGTLESHFSGTKDCRSVDNHYIFQHGKIKVYLFLGISLEIPDCCLLQNYVQHTTHHGQLFSFTCSYGLFFVLGDPLLCKLSQLSIKTILTPSKLRGLVSRLYNNLLNSSYRPLALDTLWKADFDCLSPELDWSRVWGSITMSSRNPDHQQIHYNFIHKLYLTSKKLYIMKRITEPICKLCTMNEVCTFKHMFWECPPVMDFWSQVASKLSMLLGVTIPCSPDSLILNNFSHVNLKMAKRRILLAGLTAAKKMVATCWKPPHCLSIHAWSMMFLDIAYLELSVARVHRAWSDAVEAWQGFVLHLQRICGT